jgi:hypothetical protein
VTNERTRDLARRREIVPQTSTSWLNLSVNAVVERLEENTNDRSRRDFAVICQLLRCGMDPESIWPLVHDHSKFAERGREYFDITIQNAMRAIGC